MNGDGLEVDGVAMEVDPLNSTPLLPGSERQLLYPHHHSTQDAHSSTDNFELNTDQIKHILAFGKDLQRLYNSLTMTVSNEQFKVLLQVSVRVCSCTGKSDVMMTLYHCSHAGLI